MSINLIPKGSFKRKIVRIHSSTIPACAQIAWKPKTSVMCSVDRITGVIPSELVGAEVEITFDQEKSTPDVLVIKTAVYAN